MTVYTMVSRSFTDTYRHKGLRRKLIQSLRNKGIEDEEVLHAMELLPRHYFLDTAFIEDAYEDKPFPIGEGQTISQPFTVAFQTSLLKISPGLKVLEIGTGSGYQAAVLHTMGAKVYTIERHEALYRETSLLLAAIGMGRIRCFLGDGYAGLPHHAPFDRILVTAGAPFIPEALLAQLAIGGYMVIPVDEADYQEMQRIQRVDENTYQSESHGKFRFVPFVKGVRKKSS